MKNKPSPVLEANNLQVWRGARLTLNVDHLSVFENETLAVIGPNGAGKSTLLMALSQLIPLTSGEICYRGAVLDRREALSFRRRIGLVLQDPLLMDASVFDNVATGLRFRGVPQNKTRERVEVWLKRMGIEHLRRRQARSLSGGEAQRVSLARAFALNPDILMLDEPFSALDAPTRARLLEDFQAIISDMAMTTIFVTHDMDEALLLADRVAVLFNGCLRQVGVADDVFSAPADLEIAAFVGVETVISARVTGCNDGLLEAEAHGQRFEVVGEAATDQTVVLCLRPEDVTLRFDGQEKSVSARNALKGTITRMTPQGVLVRVVVDCGFPLVALVTRPSAQQMNLSPGMSITASFKATAVHVIVR